MDLGDFFGDLFGEEYWKGSNSTGSGSYNYFSKEDEDGKPFSSIVI